MKKIIAVLFVMATLFGCVMVNQSTMQVSAVTINDEITETYNFSSDTSIANAPTVIVDVIDSQTYESILGEERPSNAIFHIDDNMNVIKQDGEIIDTFAKVYDAIKGKVIPIVYIATDNQKKAVTNFLNNKTYIYDMAIMASNPAFINYVKSRRPIVRGIMDYTSDTTSTVADIVKNTNKNQSLVAVLPQRLATADNVRYIHARFKTVWVYGGNENESISSALHTGTYGIITNDASAVYSVYKSYKSKGLVRAPFNVAHRGLPYSYNECSLRGMEEAVKAGATHIETDAYVTTDNKIVFMHDSTLDRTSNGTGFIEQKSLAELAAYKLDLKGEDPIPSFADIVPLLKNNPSVVLVLEIKSSKTYIVDVLKEALDTYDLWSQVVVISFDKTIVSTMESKLPEIPCSYLGFTDQSTYAEILEFLGTYNSGVDIDRAFVSETEYFNEQFLRDRGVITWLYTCGSVNDFTTYMEKGCVGLTTNSADKFGGLPVNAVVSSSDAVFYPNGKYSVEVTSVLGTTTSYMGDPASVIDCGDSWSVVVSYSANGGKFYSMPFTVAKAGNFSEDERLQVVAVIDKINSIPAVLQNTQYHNATIDDARSSYDALSENLKEQVTNYEKLQSAESKMSELKGSSNNDAPNNSGGCGTIVPVDTNGGNGGGTALLICVIALALLAFFVGKKRIKN